MMRERRGERRGARLTRGEAAIEPMSRVKCAATIGVDESSECALLLRTTGAILELLADRGTDHPHRLMREEGLPGSSNAAE